MERRNQVVTSEAEHYLVGAGCFSDAFTWDQEEEDYSEFLKWGQHSRTLVISVDRR